MVDELARMKDGINGITRWSLSIALGRLFFFYFSIVARASRLNLVTWKIIHPHSFLVAIAMTDMQIRWQVMNVTLMRGREGYSLPVCFIRSCDFIKDLQSDEAFV